VPQNAFNEYSDLSGLKILFFKLWEQLLVREIKMSGMKDIDKQMWKVVKPLIENLFKLNKKKQMLSSDLIKLIQDLFQRINLVMKKVLNLYPTRTFECNAES